MTLLELAYEHCKHEGETFFQFLGRLEAALRAEGNRMNMERR